MQKMGVVLVSFALGACSSLDANSDFIDAIDTVKDRKNFVEVIAKDYSPSFKTINGADIMRSGLILTANFPKADAKVPESNVYFEVSYFQTHDEYTSVSYGGSTYPLKAEKENFQNCNEHCTTTQYVSFPIDIDEIEQAADKGLDFTLSSSGKGMVTEFEIPAGYFNAVVEEAERYTVSQPAVVAAPVVVAKAPVEEASKSVQMTEYWYQEASSEVKSEFADWAFENRKGQVSEFGSAEQSAQMLEYWFSKSSESERKQIIKWLLEQ
ncbi:hypothetical protein [Vibrio hepatarius]|uniref:hypothetical protein n=1 Tax=Vibrio hepatarius TaxID=171383 RepID=UPI0037357D0B